MTTLGDRESVNPPRQSQEFLALKADIEKGLADLSEGRVKDLSVDRIAELAKTRRKR